MTGAVAPKHSVSDTADLDRLLVDTPEARAALRLTTARMRVGAKRRGEGVEESRPIRTVQVTATPTPALKLTAHDAADLDRLLVDTPDAQAALRLMTARMRVGAMRRDETKRVVAEPLGEQRPVLHARPVVPLAAEPKGEARDTADLDRLLADTRKGRAALTRMTARFRAEGSRKDKARRLVAELAEVQIAVQEEHAAVLRTTAPQGKQTATAELDGLLVDTLENRLALRITTARLRAGFLRGNAARRTVVEPIVEPSTARVAAAIDVPPSVPATLIDGENAFVPTLGPNSPPRDSDHPLFAGRSPPPTTPLQPDDTEVRPRHEDAGTGDAAVHLASRPAVTAATPLPIKEVENIAAKIYGKKAERSFRELAILHIERNKLLARSNAPDVAPTPEAAIADRSYNGRMFAETSITAADPPPIHRDPSRPAPAAVGPMPPVSAVRLTAPQTPRIDRSAPGGENSRHSDVSVPVAAAIKPGHTSNSLPLVLAFDAKPLAVPPEATWSLSPAATAVQSELVARQAGEDVRVTAPPQNVTSSALEAARQAAKPASVRFAQAPTSPLPASPDAFAIVAGAETTSRQIDDDDFEFADEDEVDRALAWIEHRSFPFEVSNPASGFSSRSGDRAITSSTDAAAFASPQVDTSSEQPVPWNPGKLPLKKRALAGVFAEYLRDHDSRRSHAARLGSIRDALGADAKELEDWVRLHIAGARRGHSAARTLLDQLIVLGAPLKGNDEKATIIKENDEIRLNGGKPVRVRPSLDPRESSPAEQFLAAAFLTARSCQGAGLERAVVRALASRRGAETDWATHFMERVAVWRADNSSDAENFRRSQPGQERLMEGSTIRDGQQLAYLAQVFQEVFDEPLLPGGRTGPNEIER